MGGSLLEKAQEGPRRRQSDTTQWTANRGGVQIRDGLANNACLNVKGRLTVKIDETG